jgi:hypothetical protein
MADMDWGNLLSGVVQNVGGYFIQQQQMKQAKKLAKIQAGSGGGGFPMLGTGNMSFGFSSAPGGMAAVQGGYGMSPAPAGSVDAGYLGQAYNYLVGGAQPSGAGCSLFIPMDSTPRARAMPLVMQQAPNGSYHYWRHVGSPVEFSRDRAICKSYLKRHGGSLRGRGRSRKY